MPTFENHNGSLQASGIWLTQYLRVFESEGGIGRKLDTLCRPQTGVFETMSS
jgi:hypothetical protein